MTSKYSRNEIIDWIEHFLIIDDDDKERLIKDLLAQKEDKKYKKLGKMGKMGKTLDKPDKGLPNQNYFWGKDEFELAKQIKKYIKPEKECHCGKNGHALNSINCPVHGYTATLNKKTVEEISTPSPLEGFEEIEEPNIPEKYFQKLPTIEQTIFQFIIQLIRNQKKLYQYIKEK